MEQHRIELLEAEIRRLRQALRNLSEAVIAGEGELRLALAAQVLLEGDELSEGS